MADDIPAFFKVFMGGVLALFILRFISAIVNCIKEDNTENENGDRRGDEDAALGRIVRALAAKEAKDKAAKDSDKRVVLEEERVEIIIHDIIEEKIVRFSAQELASITQNYSTKLGSGGYGQVFKGEFPNGLQIAVKVLNHDSVDKRVKDQFMAEVGTIGRTYHKNLVRLLGFCFNADVIALVYEYMENGSLDRFLFTGEQLIEWEQLYQIAVGEAKGLEYLHHNCDRSIIHYDIKPGNILLDFNFCPKIADFGLAKLCNKGTTTGTLTGFKGTPGYAAPEVWTPFPATNKCDVYSFGIMLFEILGRRRHIQVSSGESQDWFSKRVWDKFENGELEEVLVASRIEEKHMEKARTVAMVALWCVQFVPEARPSMTHVVQILEGGARVETPPNPFQRPSNPLPLITDSGTFSTSTTKSDGIIEIKAIGDKMGTN